MMFDQEIFVVADFSFVSLLATTFLVFGLLIIFVFVSMLLLFVLNDLLPILRPPIPLILLILVFSVLRFVVAWHRV